MKTAVIRSIVAFLLVADVAKAQLPSATVPNGIGVQTHWCVTALWKTDTTSQFDAIQASGVGFVRDDLVWAAVEQKKGQYDFSHYDAFSNAMAARGIRILWVLCYTNDLYPYYPDPKHPDSSAWRNAFTKYAAAAVEHFKGKGNIYELYNEPNGPLFWPTHSSQPEEYMALANQAIPEMRKTDPRCTIVAPALSTSGSASEVNYFTDTAFLDVCFGYGRSHPGQKGLLDLVDALSVHPYRSYPHGPETVPPQYELFRSLMRQHGKTLPLVAAEWGYSTGTKNSAFTPVPTAEVQGNYLARMCLVNLSQRIPLTIWYDWKDDGCAAQPNEPIEYEWAFGMTTMSDVKKPAYRAMQLLTKSLRGTTFSSRLPSAPNDWLLAFKTVDGRQTLAAWTTGDAHTVHVAPWGCLNLTPIPSYTNPVPERGTPSQRLGAIQ